MSYGIAVSIPHEVYLFYYITLLILQLALLKDKLEENVLHTLIVIEHVTTLDQLYALLLVLLMDVSAQLDRS